MNARLSFVACGCSLIAAWLALPSNTGAQEERQTVFQLEAARTNRLPAREQAASAANARESTDREVVRPHRVDLPALEAHVMRADRSIQRVDLAQDVTLSRGEMLVLRTAEEIKTRSVEQATRRGAVVHELPVQVFAIDDENNVRRSTLITEYTGGGLRLAENGRTYRGLVYVSLQDTADRTATYTFPQPVGLLVTAGVNNVAPDRLSLPGTNQWGEIALEDRDPASPVALRIRSTGDADDVALDIPVVRQTLRIGADRDELEGFGLAAARLTITASGVPNPEGRQVELRARPAGIFDPPSPLALDAQGQATTTLRSIRTGPVEIIASSQGLVDGRHDEIRFIAPVAFVAAAVVGGSIGALIRVLRIGRRSAWLRVARRLSAGALIGLVVAVLYAIGVNVTPIQPSVTAGEALVFALGFAGAYWGLPSTLPSS